jgi:hypothetical protein
MLPVIVPFFKTARIPRPPAESPDRSCSYGAHLLRRALPNCVKDPLSEALTRSAITTRPAFIEVFVDGKLFYRRR